MKLKKCQLGMRECIYLGYVVGNGVVEPDPEKINAVLNLPSPVTKKQVRAFFRILSAICQQLCHNCHPTDWSDQKLLPDRVQWTSECEAAFVNLKKALCGDPVLSNPDFSRQFILQTDASDMGVGAVLSQVGDDGQEQPVAYFSRNEKLRIPQ